MAKESKPQAKFQQSISSFFTRKTVNGAAKPQESAVSVTSPNASALADEDLYGAESDGIDNKAEDGKSTSILPSRGSKRALTEDWQGGNGTVDGRPGKRAKSAEGEKTPSNSGQDGKRESGLDKSSTNSPRTNRYFYGSSQNEDALDQEAIRAKERLHMKFVKKLGNPDSMVRLRSKNIQATDETGDADAEQEGGEEEEEEAAPSRAKKKGAKTGKLTPFELQMLEIKRKHMDTLLIIEVGYKFMFYGADAKVAAKELGLVCIPGKMRFDERELEDYSSTSDFAADLSRSV